MLRKDKKAVTGIRESVENEQIHLLMEFSSLLNSTLNTSTIREQAMEATCRLLHCEGATLYLVDEEKNELFFEAIVGNISSQTMKEIRLPISEQSIAGSVAFRRKSMIVNDVEHDPRHNKSSDKKNKYQTRNIVCVPVTTKGKLLGVLHAVS